MTLEIRITQNQHGKIGMNISERMKYVFFELLRGKININT